VRPAQINNKKWLEEKNMKIILKGERGTPSQTNSKGREHKFQNCFLASARGIDEVHRNGRGAELGSLICHRATYGQERCRLECHREIESGRVGTRKNKGKFECQIIERKCFEYQV